MMRVMFIAFPIVVILVHGIVWEQFGDSAGWSMLALSGAFSAIPMAVIATFVHRRKNVGEERRTAVRLAVLGAFLYTVALWLLPLVLVMVLSGELGGRRGLIWLALVAFEPVYIYPMLLVLERCVPVKRVAISQ